MEITNEIEQFLCFYYELENAFIQSSQEYSVEYVTGMESFLKELKEYGAVKILEKEYVLGNSQYQSRSVVRILLDRFDKEMLENQIEKDQVKKLRKITETFIWDLTSKCGSANIWQSLNFKEWIQALCNQTEIKLEGEKYYITISQRSLQR